MNNETIRNRIAALQANHVPSLDDPWDREWMLAMGIEIVHDEPMWLALFVWAGGIALPPIGHYEKRLTRRQVLTLALVFEHDIAQVRKAPEPPAASQEQGQASQKPRPGASPGGSPPNPPGSILGAPASSENAGETAEERARRLSPREMDDVWKMLGEHVVDLQRLERCRHELDRRQDKHKTELYVNLETHAERIRGLASAVDVLQGRVNDVVAETGDHDDCVAELYLIAARQRKKMKRLKRRVHEVELRIGRLEKDVHDDRHASSSTVADLIMSVQRMKDDIQVLQKCASSWLVMRHEDQLNRPMPDAPPPIVREDWFGHGPVADVPGDVHASSLGKSGPGVDAVTQTSQSEQEPPGSRDSMTRRIGAAKAEHRAFEDVARGNSAELERLGSPTSD